MTSRPHIVVIASYCLGEEPVIRNRLKAFVDVLDYRGWTVTLVSPEPTSAAAAASDGELKCKRVYVRNIRYDRTKFFKRAVNEVILARRLALIARSIRCNVRMASIPSMFLMLQDLTDVHTGCVIDVRDLVWEYLPKKGVCYPAAAAYLRYRAARAFRRADFVTVSNREEEAYVRAIDPRVDPILITNGISRSQFERLRGLHYTDSNPNFLRILYIGNIGLAQDLTTIIEAVANDRRFRLKIVGGGNDLPRIRNELDRIQANNIELVGQLAWPKVEEYYANADVLYAQLKPEFATAVPSKLYEYLATGLRIVYGGVGAALKMVGAFEGIVVVPPGDSTTLRRALEGLRGDVSGGRMVRNIDRIGQQFIREDAVEHFEIRLRERVRFSIIP